MGKGLACRSIQQPIQQLAAVLPPKMDWTHMSKEIAGFNNHLILHSNGSVTKFFHNDGITARSAQVRLAAEASALRRVALAPQLLSLTQSSVTMQQMEGENWLDDVIDTEREHLQYEVFFTAGKALRFIHDQNKQPLSYLWFSNFIEQNLALLRANLALGNMEIDYGNLENYVQYGVNFETLQAHGIGLVHGDYWLNNVIGKLNHKFQLSGVIDWEASGIGSPYQDFAIVKMSIEDRHPNAKGAFWQGYGQTPNPSVVKYFCVRQILTWLSEDQQIDPNSPFYKPKIELLRSI